MTWSNNAEPVNMVRLVNLSIRLPSFLSHLGPVRIDQFFVGSWDIRISQTFVYGKRLTSTLPFLELGFDGEHDRAQEASR